jgi:hypothetical protein
VAVLGAGLTGVGAALELARNDVDVTLIDQDDAPMNRAGLRNEGKIHLGLNYAKDASLATARTLLDGALRFRALLERWVGPAADGLATSTAFVYLVARDLLLRSEDLEAYYASVDSLYRERLAGDPRLDYLGLRPERLYDGCGRGLLDAVFRRSHVADAFQTVERAIDTDELARLLRRVVAESARIRFRPGRRVEGVESSGGAFRVEGSGPAGSWRLVADQVVNALWEGRRRIDSSFGLVPDPGWLHRLKFRTIVKLPAMLRRAPSASMVLGRYGDVVILPRGTACLSWYPVGLQGWTHELGPPESWDGPCRGEVDSAQACWMAAETIAAIEPWYPGHWTVKTPARRCRCHRGARVHGCRRRG